MACFTRQDVVSYALKSTKITTMKATTLIIFMIISFFSFSQAPTSNFSATPLEVCIGDAINFSDLSVAGGSPIDLWSWDFGDGNSSNLVNPSHTYSLTGTYTVTLVVTAQNGQADAEVKVNYVIVHDLPNAGFTISGNGCTVPFDVVFSNTSSTGASITYDWDFGNTQTSTSQNPAPITYSSAGTFNVTLIVTNTTTGCTNSYSENIVVSDYSSEFTAPLTGCVNSAITFTDASTVGSNQWNWDFGDGQTSTQQNPNNTYGAPGTYTVTLTSQNTGSGCSDVITHDITINPLPTPSFTADITTGCAPLTVSYTNTSVGGVTYDWDFGNGNTFSGANPLPQVYSNEGVFTVSLTMTDANGCSATFTDFNLIDVSAPVVQFSMDQYNGCDPLTVLFTDGSTSPNPIADPLSTWLWDFGDGSPISSGQFPPPHIYNEGVYSVTLTIFTVGGCTASLTLTDTIQVGSIDVVNFSVNPIIECAKTPIDFIDSTTFNGTPGPGEVNYNWDFGDGGTSTQQSPSYSYPSDTGYFDVTLVVEWRGCYDTLVIPQAVYIKAPISIFSPDMNLYCNPGSFPVNVGVTDNSIIGELPDDAEMTWDWGDGTFTYFDDPDFDDVDQGSTTHDYTTYGSYTIEQVIINNTTGCSDSTTTLVHISQTIAAFTVSNDSTCVGSAIDLTSTSTSSHPFGTYAYTMGNGGVAGGSPTSYTYNSFGQFDILLTATNNVGCSDTVSFINMNALALPQAGITPSDVTGCAPITVDYANSSVVVGNGVPFSSFLWTFPDLSTQVTTNIGTNTNYGFTTEGSFTTSMVVTDEFGCVSPSTSVNMTITKPVASFILDSVVCDLEVFTTNNTSSGATSYLWNMDGGQVGTNTDYSSFFDEVTSSSYNSVIHNLQLIATDVNGCVDSTNQDIVVSMPRAEIDFVLTGANVNAQGDFTCPPVFADFTDATDSYGNITGWSWSFGDGKFSTLQDPSNTYVFAGTYTANLTITDEFGCTNDTTLVDYLTIFGPSGDPDWLDLGDVCGKTYQFEAQNLVSVTEIIWDLGDGQTINDINPFDHTYDDYNVYNPTATLIDSLGCEVVFELDPIVLISNGLNALFDLAPQEGPIGTVFTIDDQSSFTSSPIVTWVWDLNGDTTINNGGSIIQPFGLPGTYPITLTITDANGCTNTYSSFAIVNGDFSLPNVITVNNDGTNDLFILPADIFESFDIFILNRWGNAVHEEYSATGVLLWDGMAQSGNPVSDGVYFYKLIGTLVNGEIAEKDGFVTVIRD